MGSHRVVNSCTIDPSRTGRGGHERPPLAGHALQSASLSIPTSTARSARSSSPPIRNSPKASWGSPVRADRVDPIEVGEHEDVEQLGAGSRTERVQALPDSPFQLVGSHCGEATPR
jgi:hypothetical protein